MNRPSFVYAIHIATTPEKLWWALISPEFTSRYWAGRNVGGDFRKGGRIVMTQADGSPDFEGEILEFDPPHRLVFEFLVQDGGRLQAEGPSRVTYEIAQKAKTVSLNVTHDGFPENSLVYDGISNGWPAILSGLKTLLETGNPMGYEWEDCA